MSAGNQQLTTATLAPVEKRMAELGLAPERVKREISFALQAVNSNPQLSKCSPGSIMAAIVQVANIGLTLNPAANECAIIPRWTREGTAASLEPMYQGLARLAMREGHVVQINAQLVHEKDDVSMDLADNKNPISHRVNPMIKNRGEIMGAYCISTDRLGYRQATLMYRDEIEHIRDGSDGYKAFAAGTIKSHPWDAHFGEMARKTVLKRHVKYLNRKGDESQLSAAIAIDNENYSAKDWQVRKIQWLLETSTFDHDYRARIEDEVSEYTYEDANAAIAKLEQNQLGDDPRYDDRVNKTKAGAAAVAQVENERA